MSGAAPKVGISSAARSLSADETRVLALANLGLLPAGATGGRSADIPAIALRAAALRAALWALTSEGTEPVFITRLLRAAVRLAAPGLMPLEDGDPDGDFEATEAESHLNSPLYEVMRDTLAELDAIGDAAELPRGRWLPGPLRLVPLPAIGRWVLVGGRPTYRLPTALRAAMELSGPARLLTRDPRGGGDELPQQPLEDWCRTPREALLPWTRRALEDIALAPLEMPDPGFEYYAAAARSARGNLQFRRWRAGSTSLPDGRYLMRHRSRRGPTRHAIAQVSAEKVVATGSLPPGGDDVRRLQYGLDILADRPTSVLATRTGTAVRFVLRNELPRAEHRLFTALGRLHLPDGGSYYPRTWETPAAHAEQLMGALRELGVRVAGLDG